MRIPFHIKNTILKRLIRPSLDPRHFIDLGVSVALFWYLENAVLFAATNRQELFILREIDHGDLPNITVLNQST